MALARESNQMSGSATRTGMKARLSLRRGIRPNAEHEKYLTLENCSSMLRTKSSRSFCTRKLRTSRLIASPSVVIEGSAFIMFCAANEPISYSRLSASTFVTTTDRKSTRLNSSHSQISYAVFCSKKKKEIFGHRQRRQCDSHTGAVRLIHLPEHQRGFFFFNDTATTEIYTLSLHDALPI